MATYRFDEIAINSTKKKKPTEEDKVHYIGLEHIDPGCFNIVRWGSDVAPTGDKLLMQKGDVLFGKRRAYQRKVGIAPFDGIFSAHGMVLRPNTEIIDANYFPFFISSDRFMETAVRISVGGLSPTINWKDLAKQEFDLPPLEEQKVLADKLWAAYRLKEGYKKLLVATDEMVKSQFIEMFYNDNFICEKLKEHIEVIRGVSYKPTDVRDAKDKDSSVILRSNNIFNGLINYDDIVFVDSTRVSEDEDYIVKSPVRRIHKVKVGKTVKETYTDEALEQMRDYCDGIRDLALIDLLASTGMRVGELVKLNREDIDFQNRECIVTGKGDKQRKVYFDARTKIHLQRYLNERNDNNPALFVSLLAPYERLQISGVEIRLRRLGRELNIPKVHPHKFRSTLATMAIDKGMPIEQVQHLLGHQSLDTTLQYAMVNQTNVKLSHRKFIG